LMDVNLSIKLLRFYLSLSRKKPLSLLQAKLKKTKFSTISYKENAFFDLNSNIFFLNNRKLFV
jgi:hypothetical protein